MIYFIQDDSTLAIKIGLTTNDPEARLKQLQTGSAGGFHLLGTCDGTKETEAALHAKFAAARVRGEWFSPTPELLLHIIGLIRPTQVQNQPKCDFMSKWRGADSQANPLNIYLAGKIGRYGDHHWRSNIIQDADSLGWIDPLEIGEEADLDSEWPVMKRMIGPHSFTGPFRVQRVIRESDDGSGHCNGDADADAIPPPHCHSCDGPSSDHCDDDSTNRRGIVLKCFKAIEKSDLLFAWITTPDCHGTLVEIGYAKAMGKAVACACPPTFDYQKQMWFPAFSSDANFINVYTDPMRALESMIGYLYRPYFKSELTHAPAR